MTSQPDPVRRSEDQQGLVLKAPTAFISYSWDDEAHKKWVKQLAIRLTEDGVDVTLDRWDSAPGDQIPAFMERAVRENDFVIAICTPRFKERSDDRGGGVGYEGDIMTAYAFTGGNKGKFIPVLRRGSWHESAPTWLLGIAYLNLSADPYSESEYEDLLRTLHRAREKKPKLGKRPNFEDDLPSQAAGAGIETITFRNDTGIPNPAAGKVTVIGKGNLQDPAANTESAKYHARFLHSIISSKEFREIGLVYHPYSEFLNNTDAPNFAVVTVYLWVPDPSYFEDPNIQDTCIVAICDAGMLEVEKKEHQIEFGWLQEECFPRTPSKLLTTKMAKLVTIIGKVMRGTFILAAVVPKLLLGAGLKKPLVSYQSILNTVLFPLVVVHSQMGFAQFRLVFPDLPSDKHECNDEIVSLGKRVLKTGYSGKRFSATHVQSESPEFFYIYAAKFISWAVNRYYNHSDKSWLEKLDEAFKQ